MWSPRLYPTACSWHGGLLELAASIDLTCQRDFPNGWFWAWLVFLASVFSLKPVFIVHPKSCTKNGNKGASKKTGATGALLLEPEWEMT